MRKMRTCMVLAFLLVFAFGLSAMAKQTDGALSGNILNGGLAAVQNGEMIFVNESHGDALYKGEELLCAAPVSYLNVKDDDIYFISEGDIFRMDADRAAMLLYAGECSNLLLHENRLYFIENKKIMWLDEEGKSGTLAFHEAEKFMLLPKGVLYETEELTDMDGFAYMANKLYFNDTLLTDCAKSWDTDGQSVYYADTQGICSYDLETGETKLLKEGNFANLIYYDAYLYYIDMADKNYPLWTWYLEEDIATATDFTMVSAFNVTPHGLLVQEAAKENVVRERQDESIRLMAAHQPVSNATITTYATEQALFVMDCLNISQGMNGSYSHMGTYAIDFPGRDTGIDPVYTPFSGTIKAKYSNGNTIWFQSNQPVQYADGTVDYMVLMMVHDNDTSDLWVGRSIPQWTHFYSEGTAGNATGNHIHLECGRGTFYDPYGNGQSWYKNGYGVWMIYNAVQPPDCLALKKSTVIYTTYGYNWRYAKEQEFRACLDMPTENSAETEATMEIKGWAIYRDYMKKMTYSIDGGAQIPLTLYRRSDVASAYGDYPSTNNSFSGVADISALNNGNHTLKIIGTDTQNATHTVANITFVVKKHPSQSLVFTPKGDALSVTGSVTVERESFTSHLRIDGKDFALKVGADGQVNQTIDIGDLQIGFHEVTLVSESDGQTFYTQTEGFTTEGALKTTGFAGRQLVVRHEAFVESYENQALPTFENGKIRVDSGAFVTKKEFSVPYTVSFTTEGFTGSLKIGTSERYIVVSANQIGKTATVTDDGSYLTLFSEGKKIATADVADITIGKVVLMTNSESDGYIKDFAVVEGEGSRFTFNHAASVWMEKNVVQVILPAASPVTNVKIDKPANVTEMTVDGKNVRNALFSIADGATHSLSFDGVRYRMTVTVDKDSAKVMNKNEGFALYGHTKTMPAGWKIFTGDFGCNQEYLYASDSVSQGHPCLYSTVVASGRHAFTADIQNICNTEGANTGSAYVAFRCRDNNWATTPRGVWIKLNHDGVWLVENEGYRSGVLGVTGLSGINFHERFTTIRVLDDQETITFSIKTTDGDWLDIYRFNGMANGGSSYQVENLITGESATVKLESSGYASAGKGFFAIWHHNDAEGFVSELRVKNVFITWPEGDGVFGAMPEITSLDLVDPATGYSAAVSLTIGDPIGQKDESYVGRYTPVYATLKEGTKLCDLIPQAATNLHTDIVTKYQEGLGLFVIIKTPDKFRSRRYLVMAEDKPQTKPELRINELRTDGGKTEANISVLTEENTAKAMLCFYAQNGRFLGTVTKELTPDGIQNADLQSDAYTEAAYVRVFLWNGIDNIKPLCESREAEM